MVRVFHCLMSIALSTSLFGGGEAARNLGKIARHATQVIKASNSSMAANSSMVANSSVAVSNSSMKNSSIALANSSAMAIPRPGTLRVCNAYPGGLLTATVGYPKPRYKSGAASHKDCVSMAGDFKAGDTVEIYFGNGRKTAVYLPYPPYANHAVILLVVYGNANSNGGFDIKMQYFRNLKYPQVAAIDCTPAGTAPAKLTLEHLDPKAPTESVEYDKVGPIDPGLTNVLFNGKPAQGGQFNAKWAESYAIMRTGDSEVAIYPSTSAGSRRCLAIASFVVASISLAVF